MAGFSSIKITKQGAILAAKTIVGKKIEFAYVEVGSGVRTRASGALDRGWCPH